MKCVLDDQIMSRYVGTGRKLVNWYLQLCTIGGETGVHRGTVPPLEREILTMTLGVAWKE